MSSSLYIENKKKDISILGKGPTQGFDHTTLAPEKEYSFHSILMSNKINLN